MGVLRGFSWDGLRGGISVLGRSVGFPLQGWCGMVASGGRKHLLFAPDCGWHRGAWGSFADGVEGLFQGGVIVIVVAVGLDGAKAFDPEVFSTFE